MEINRELPPRETKRISDDPAVVLLEDFKNTKSIERRKEIIADLLDELAGALGAEGLEMGTETQAIYREIAAAPNMLVRQERFDQLLKLIGNGRIDISFFGNEPYANAAVFGANGEGLEIAFKEGRASGYGITTLISIDPGTSEGRLLEISPTPPAQCELRDRSVCRSVSGMISKASVAHAVVRIPKTMVPENYLTPDDEEDGRYVFRTVSFRKKN